MRVGRIDAIGSIAAPWRVVARSAVVLLFAPVSVLAAAGPIEIDAAGTVAGRVVDAVSEAPLSDAVVALEPLHCRPPLCRVLRVRTDGAGAYRFDAVPRGPYRLVVSDPPGARLLPEPAAPPARITVRGPRSGETGPSRAVLTRHDIDQSIAAFGDPFRALASSPGVAAQNDFKAELRVRGGEVTETTVLLDGAPVAYPFHFAGGAGSAATVGGGIAGQVELATGGFSVEHGDALAGVVAISTRDDRPAQPTTRVALSTLAAQAGLAGPIGAGAWNVAIRGSDPAVYEDRVGDEIRSLAMHDLHATLRLPLRGGGRFEAGLLEAGNRYDELPAAGDAGAMRSASRAARARIDLPFSGRALLRALVSAGRTMVDSSAGGGVRLEQHQDRLDLRVSFTRLVSARHELTLGAERSLVEGPVSGAIPDGYALVEGALNHRARTIGLFVEDVYTRETLAVRYGVRKDGFSATGERTLSARAGFDVRLRHGVTVRAAVGRFVQFPRQEEIFLAEGEALRHQSADDAIVGPERRFSGGTTLSVETYYKNVRRRIGESVNLYVDLPEQMMQFDSGRVRGAEASLDRPGRLWRWSVRYAWMEALQFEAGTETPRNGDGRHAATLCLGRRFGRGWDASAMLRYGSGLPYTPQRPWSDGHAYGRSIGALNSARLPAYHRLDLRLSRGVERGRGRIDAFVELLNVYDRANVRAVELEHDVLGEVFREMDRHQAPFTPVIGISAEF